MRNKKGQSLIDVVFSIGILVLMLTGVVTLMVTTTKVKTVTLERKKMVELSQLLIEKKILEVKNNPLDFWGVTHENENDQDAGFVDASFAGYKYDAKYDPCNAQKCNVIFKVKSKQGNPDLSVERLFVKYGI